MKILYIEPFDGGSHAAFTKQLTSIDAEWRTLTLPGRHWKWRMRGAVPYFVRTHADTLTSPTDLVFASSYVPLAELYGLTPLVGTPSILYFHENQLTYPTRTDGERDHHFGFTQLVSALAATACWFNSAYNRDSFLDAGENLLKRMPDAVAPGWIESIRAKSEVMPVPLCLPDVAPTTAPQDGPPLVLWNHRWEHDKAPEEFFAALERIDERQIHFQLAVCGQSFERYPKVFDHARERFRDLMVHFGEADRSTYERLLKRADIAVSTARHEFFGLAMLEAAHFGAYPLVPDDLAYPELFGPQFRYARQGLVDRLATLLTQAGPLRADRRALTAPFGSALLSRYQDRMATLAT